MQAKNNPKVFDHFCDYFKWSSVFALFAHFCCLFYICIFLYSFNFSTNLIFHIYLFVYLLVVFDIARALCMTQWGLLFFQRNTFVQLILFILFLISMTLIYIFISVVTIFLLSLSLIYLCIKFLRFKADIIKNKRFLPS